MTSRQEEIIDRSIEIIATKGIQGLTIKNLSREIGISEPAIYRHFESKTDILLAILDKFNDILSFMNGELKDKDVSALQKIDYLFSKVISIFTEEPSHISVIFSEEIFKNEKVLKTKIVAIMNNKRDFIKSVLLEGQKRNEIRDDIDYRTLTLIVMGTLRFMIKQWDIRDHNENLDTEGKKLIDGLKKMLKK
jgi:AcrR family transcriptional regulator